MRLYLAVALLMLAFVAYTEAQEETIEQKLAKFGEHITEMSRNLGEKVKTAFQDINTNEMATNAKNWFTEQYERLVGNKPQ